MLDLLDGTIRVDLVRTSKRQVTVHFSIISYEGRELPVHIFINGENGEHTTTPSEPDVKLVVKACYKYHCEAEVFVKNPYCNPSFKAFGEKWSRFLTIRREYDDIVVIHSHNRLEFAGEHFERGGEHNRVNYNAWPEENISRIQ